MKKYIDLNILETNYLGIRNEVYSHDRRGSVGWVLVCKAKGHQFDSWPGHMPVVAGLVRGQLGCI